MLCTLTTTDGLLYTCPVHGTEIRLPAARWLEIRTDCEARQLPKESPEVPDQAQKQPTAGPLPRPTTEAIIEQRYTEGLAKVPREVAEARLETCREDCDAHFCDCLGLDRCKKCIGCQGKAALSLVRRLTGELTPVDGCPWAES
jgi:hypothetical protein